ncbi:hypothetical protein G7Z99_04820 [Pseudomonas entomophila]|uniref:dermonecrotic toxin domain-containing protein n=1 Tax=Pseudomonas entomophila TaxID=312306 RepID=UPI0015E3FB14|nr:DUF6543 domain-containing protein [Pseudomonas entomophila]MBA1188366.1 hypothetical protein [Pseudomonas entomophila]
MTNRPDVVPDYQRAVAAEFAARPTLRQLIARQALAVLSEAHTSVAAAGLPDAEPLVLLIPQPHQWSRASLVDTLLEALLQGVPLERLGERDGEFLITSSPDYPLRDHQGQALEGATSIRGQMGALDEAVQALIETFCQAQRDYWAAPGSLGASRDQWLQLTLKSALLQNLPLHGLDARQAACVRGVLRGGTGRPTVFAIEVELQDAGTSRRVALPNLLISGEYDERQVLLWCAPSSTVQAFDSFDAFVQRLHEELAEPYRFDTLTWHRYVLEGNVFAQQTALMLDSLLQAARSVWYWQSADLPALEALFAQLTDPAAFFISGYQVASSSDMTLPPGLRAVTDAEGFLCQDALFELALAQAESLGTTSRDQLQDLREYTRQALREALLGDHPDDANYFPDDLVLTLSLARGTPGGAATGPGDSAVDTFEMTLTDYAIGDLGDARDATLSAVAHRNGQLIMPWLTLDYLDALVSRVDVGRRYPAHVARFMDAPAGKPERIACFAREWRSALLFSALQGKLAGTLDAAALQCVTDYCRGWLDPELPRMALMPLAFKAGEEDDGVDVVRGMYVLFCAEPTYVLLYRPLYENAPLMVFETFDALMSAIAREGALQTSVLDWLPDQARRVYDNGGFLEPHRLTPILDEAGFLLPVKPAVLHKRLWRQDVDTRLYEANRDLLVALADRRSWSTAEKHWASLVRGAWLLFDTVSLVVRGPVATVAWLAQGIAALGQDLPVLAHGTGAQRVAAIVDLIVNLGLAVAHLKLPRETPVLAQPVLAASTGRLARPEVSVPQRTALVRAGHLDAPYALAARGEASVDFSWRGAHGFNVLTPTQRARLRAMRSSVDLRDAPEQAGLYRVGDRHYVSMRGDAYEVQVSQEGVRILDTQGEKGPWLQRTEGVWRVDSALALRGGMPKSRVELRREQNRARLMALQEQENTLTTQRNAQAKVFEAHRRLLLEKEDSIGELEAIAHPDELQARELALLKDLRQRIRETVTYDMKALVDLDVKNDQVAGEIFDLRHVDASLEEAIALHRRAVRQELIGNCKLLYNELASLINEAGAQTLSDTIAILPEEASEIEQYRRFRTTLEKVVKWEADAISVSQHFDRLLEATLNDPTISFKDPDTGVKLDKTVYLSGVIEQRKVNAVDLEVRLLLDLGELSLDRLAGGDEQTLKAFQAYLTGESLQSAAAAHGDLSQSELSVEERISVLTSVVEAYEEAAASADYLRSISTTVVRLETLEEYRTVLNRLKEQAEHELAQAVREKELALPRTRQPRVYASRGGKRRVVKTQRGRSVVGTEVEIDGVPVIEQRDARTDQVIKTFRRQGSQWAEEVKPDPAATSESPETAPAPDALRQRGRALVGEVESIIRLARQYVRSDEPHGLSSVIDLHVEKLEEVQARLPRTDQDAALHLELSESRERLQHTRRDLLVGLYLATSHPSASSLRFLVEHGAVRVERAGPRKPLSEHDYLDVYEIRRQPVSGQTKGSGLWEAHFHYPEATTPGPAFSKGHLKLWSQRKLGREAQLRAATTGKDLLAIYRGDLKPHEVDGLIPFD